MYKKGIITNTPKDSAIKILEKLEIEYYFDSILTSDDVSISKPDPEIVLKSCKLLDVEQKDVVLVGDTESDVRAGRAAGCIVIGLNVNADYIIRDISELPLLFQ
jgi:HAD superfamily hydrolase (TIGR01549 family)